MITSIVTRDTRKEDWPKIRSTMKSRILETFGTSPVEFTPKKNEYEELERYVSYGLEHIKIKYHIFDDEWGYGILILPRDIYKKRHARAVLTIHGTNGTVGKYGVCNLEGRPNRAYAIELAQRGYVTFSPDQYGYGEAMEDADWKKRFDEFYEWYPDWSLSSRRVLGHIRALDVLDQLEYIDHSGYGVIGNSLGGQASFYIAAFDDRIQAAVISTGISPNVTNVYRDLTRTQHLELAVTNYIKKTGKTPWELNEMLALCAPKAVLCLEPFNDHCNPYTSVTIDCIRSAWEVYKLIDAPEKLSMYIHGDGHDTIDIVREFAYNWMQKNLK